MSFYSRILCCAAALILAAGEARAFDNEETPATPTKRTPPDYPTACLPAPGVAIETQRVTIVYGVTENGYAENVRVRETTDPCFNDAAMSAVRYWNFEPRRVNGRAQPQEDIETTFSFVLQETTGIEDFDARALVRVPPRYPGQCFEGAKPRENVLIEFDVTAEGETENVRVVDSTNFCHIGAALASVRKWKYRPKFESGTPVARKGVQTNVAFEISDGPLSSEFIVRPALSKRFKGVQKSISKGLEPAKLLEEFASIEKEYGETFTHPEAAGFHQLRGVARLTNKDYRGALDDLRIAVRMGRAGGSAEVIGETIKQLEGIVAAQDAQIAKEQEQQAQEQ